MLVKRIEKMIDVIQVMLEKSDIDGKLAIDESTSSNTKGVNKSFKLTDDEDHKFIFKPQSGEHTSKWRHVPAHTQYKRERAAYLTSITLNWKFVPDTKIISYKDQIGSLQEWVDGTTKSDKSLETYSSADIWKAGLFDIIIGNADRHSGNWLTMKKKFVLIDHGYSFPVSAGEDDPRSVILSRFAYRIWGRRIPSELMRDMQNLHDIKFQEHIYNLVGKDATRLFQERLRELVDKKMACVSQYRCAERVTHTPPEK